MRPSHSLLAAAVTTAMLGGCDWPWDRFVNMPMVCPSSVDVDSSRLSQGFIRFRPYVHNRGVDDSTVPFNLYMHVTRTSNGVTANAYDNVYIPNTTIIPGTHAKPGVTAGPETELTSASTLSSWWIRYDPQAIYGVTLDFKSSNQGIDLASSDCRHLGPVNFKGGERV